MSDLIERQAAIEAMLQLERDDEESYGASIPEGFDGARAVEALKEIPSAQPEPSIPISWIKKRIDWLTRLDNAFSSLSANTLDVMVKQYEEEHEFDAKAEE